MDLTRTIVYRGFVLNDATILTDIAKGVGAGRGIKGCVVDSADYSDVDVVQFLEKRSQQDGMDAGDVFLGTRRVRLAGTLYNTTRALLHDDLFALRAALSPILAQRESPLDRGYQPLYFSLPTNRIAEYPSATIDLQMRLLPRAFQAMFARHAQGGNDANALAIPWQATFIAKDPSIMAVLPVDLVHPTQTLVTGATAAAATDLVTQTAHGLLSTDRVEFTTLTGGTGLATNIAYYVLASGLTADAFKVSTSSGGVAIDITVDYSVASYVKSVTDAGTLTNRGNYLCPVNALWVVGAAQGYIYGTIGDSTFIITIPASTGPRTIRFKGEDKVITVEEDAVEVPRYDILTFTNQSTWPLVGPATSSYSFTFHGGVLAAGSHTWFFERYA